MAGGSLEVAVAVEILFILERRYRGHLSLSPSLSRSTDFPLFSLSRFVVVVVGVLAAINESAA